jgi:hypothetical protein
VNKTGQIDLLTTLKASRLTATNSARNPVTAAVLLTPIEGAPTERSGGGFANYFHSVLGFGGSGVGARPTV